MHIHIRVIAERNLGHAVRAAYGPVRHFHLANRDPPGERAGIAEDAVVGNLHVVVPAVQEDAATALGAVGEGNAIDARRVAEEVAGIVCAILCACRQRHADAICDAIGVGLSTDVLHAFPQNRNRRAFVGTHQRGLYQKLAQIAVERIVPTDGWLEWYRVDPPLHGQGIGRRTRAAAVGVRRIEGIRRRNRTAVA